MDLVCPVVIVFWFPFGERHTDPHEIVGQAIQHCLESWRQHGFTTTAMEALQIYAIRHNRLSIRLHVNRDSLHP